MFPSRRSLLVFPALAAEEPESILVRATKFDEANYLALKAYVWNSEEIGWRRGQEERQQKYEINMVSGTMYWRKLEHMRRPLAGAQAELEASRLKQHLAAPRSPDGLPPDNGWRFERAFAEEIPKLHRIDKFRLESGTFHLRLKPRRDARTQHPLSDFVHSFEIDVWLDEDSLHWTRAAWKATRKVSWRLRQLPLGRLTMVYSNNIVYQGTLNKNDTFRWTLQRLKDGPWALDRYETDAGSYRNELCYFNYRRYTTESELIP
jgi:hypothetical protein